MIFALFLSGITIAPPVSITCQSVGTELFYASRLGHISQAHAAQVFERCQKDFPPLSP